MLRIRKPRPRRDKRDYPRKRTLTLYGYIELYYFMNGLGVPVMYKHLDVANAPVLTVR